MSSPAEEIAKLHELLVKGQLTQAEFEQGKAQILGSRPAAGANSVAVGSRLRRSSTDYWLGGVCGGLGKVTGIKFVGLAPDRHHMHPPVFRHRLHRVPVAMVFCAVGHVGALPLFCLRRSRTVHNRRTPVRKAPARGHRRLCSMGTQEAAAPGRGILEGQRSHSGCFTSQISGVADITDTACVMLCGARG